MTPKKRIWLIEKIRQVFSAYGFEPLETPVLEYASLLTGKYGEEAEKLMYRFEDRGGRNVAMRYDQTVPTARVVAQYQNELTFPYKRYQIQPVWRADKPQKGRYREFIQCDADIIGSASTIADAEILAVYYAIYEAIGLNSIRIEVNDRQQLIATVKSAGVNEDKVLSIVQTVDKIKKISQNELADELESKGMSADASRSLLAALKAATPSDNLQGIIEAAVVLGVPRTALVFEPTLARGLDYYTGLIFEGSIPEYTVGSVGGGGRYDNLLNSLVGINKPAVGFGLGFDRTLEAAEQLGNLPSFNNKKVMVGVFGPEYVTDSLKLTAMLRSGGIWAECYPDAEQKLEKQIKYALKKGSTFMCIVGQDELDTSTVTVKNLTKNTQESISRNAVVSFLQSS
ncbi:MAG: Histidine--tRNA ligase [Microgenomates bacterium OLB23]|nr:MAG: Histidine--tRNA ligase [Microgenomates bacterium OLB23]